MAIKHTFVSAKPDSADPTLVSSSEWNDNHAIDAATITKAMIENVANQRLLGRNTGGAGVVEEITASQLLDWASSTNGVLLTRTAGTWGAAANVAIDGGDLMLTEQPTPSTPAATKIKVIARAPARSMPAWVDANGIAADVQPHIGRKHIGHWLAPGGATTLPLAYGMAAPTTGGTATSRNPATTNLATSLRRLGYVSAAGAGSVCGARNTGPQFFRGNAAGVGGFHAVFKFSVSDAVLVATANMFVGFNASGAAMADVAPSTLANIVGVGCDNGDTVLQLYAAGAAAQARTSLGANFPVNTVSVDVYELILYAPPNGADIKYYVRRANTGDVATGTISAGAALPSSTTFLAQQFHRSNGGTAAAVAIDFVSHYIETEE
jgi:hypothetical protein